MTKTSVAFMDTKVKRVGNSLGFTVPAPLAREHALIEGEAGSLHVEVEASNDGEVVRYVYEIRHRTRRRSVRQGRPMSWYFERAAKKGLGVYAANEILPDDAPRGRELW